MTFAEDTLATIEEIAGGAVTELIEDEDKNASSTTYPTLTRYICTYVRSKSLGIKTWLAVCGEIVNVYLAFEGMVCHPTEASSKAET